MAKQKQKNEVIVMTTTTTESKEQNGANNNNANGGGDESSDAKSPPISSNNGATSSTTMTSSSSNSGNNHCYYYLTADARQHLPRYQYRGCDRSLLYHYVLSPLAEWLVQTCVPTTMAPNTITLIGLMGMISSYLLYWWYHGPMMEQFLLMVEDGDKTTVTAAAATTAASLPLPPNWIYLYNAMAMLAYQTLDNMDGKQARRTHSSSPLGLLFDHGCDAINSIFGSVNWILGMGLVLSTLQLQGNENDASVVDDDDDDDTASTSVFFFLLQSFVLIFGPFAMFYVATWEQYHTGELILPIINGPNEGLLGGVLLSLTSYWYGPAYWQGYEWYERLVGALPPSSWSSNHNVLRLRNCDFVILASSIGFVQEIVWKTFTVVLSHDKNKKHKAPPTLGTITTTNAAAIQSLLPFVCLSGCFFVLGVYQPNLLIHNPRTALHLAALLFVEISTELMLAHVTAQPFHTWRRWQLLPLMVLTIWVVVFSAEFISSSEDDKLQHYQYYSYYTNYLTAYTWSMGVYLTIKCVMVVHEICNVLQIWCFDIVTLYDNNHSGTTPQGTTRRRKRRTIRDGNVPTKPVKTVYLIRHAESKENERMTSLSRVVRSLAKFQFSHNDWSADIWAAMELLNVYGQVDSPVSRKGAQQIANMRRILDQTNFLEVANIQLVAHSPLIRACQTCEGMLGCIGGETAAVAVPAPKVPKMTNRVARVLKTDRLIEKSPMEWTPLRYHRFLDRIDDLETWLWDQDEESVALVGHSQFFKAMLGLDFKFGNCDVWKVQFDLASVKKSQSTTMCGDKNNDEDGQWILPPQWSNLELLYACQHHHRPNNKSD